MREIKYQAYDSANAKMLDWGTLKSHLIFPGTSGWYWREYTGLKDKNGKEIYEGDIVKFEQFIGQIVWDYSGFMLRVNKIIYAIWRDCEVIGNIYENPDLLVSATTKTE